MQSGLHVPANGFANPTSVGQQTSGSNPAFVTSLHRFKTTSDTGTKLTALNDCLKEMISSFKGATGLGISMSKGKADRVLDSLNELHKKVEEELPMMPNPMSRYSAVDSVFFNSISVDLSSITSGSDFTKLLGKSKKNPKRRLATILQQQITQLSQGLESTLPSAPKPPPRSQFIQAQQANLNIGGYEVPVPGGGGPADYRTAADAFALYAQPTDGVEVVSGPADYRASAGDAAGNAVYVAPTPVGAVDYRAAGGVAAYLYSDANADPVTLNFIPGDGEVFPTSTTDSVNTLLQNEGDFAFYQTVSLYQNDTIPHFAFNLGGTVYDYTLEKGTDNTYTLKFGVSEIRGTCEQLKDLLNNWGVNKHPFGEDAKGSFEVPSGDSFVTYSVPVEDQTVVRSSSSTFMVPVERQTVVRSSSSPFMVPSYEPDSFLPNDIAQFLLNSASSQPGDYVLRQSEGSDKTTTCSISMKTLNGIKNYRIQHDPSNVETPFTLKSKRLGDQPFQDFNALVNHLKRQNSV